MTLSAAALIVVNAYLVRTLPYPSAQRLYNVRYAAPGASQPRGMEALDWAALGDAIEHTIAWDLDMFYLLGGDHAEAAPGAWVTPGFMQGLGIQPAFGRGFDAGAFVSGSPQVALISHRLWQSRFSGDPQILGRRFEAYVSDRPEEAEAFTIVGVLPADFWHVNPYTEVLAPLRAPTYPYLVRLREGVAPGDAAARMTALVRGSASGLTPDWRVEIVSAHEQYVTTIRPILRAIWGAAILVLLTAWANVAGLLLIRAARRRKEIAVRMALGAGGGAIARLLLLEGAVLGTAATVIGLVAGGLADQRPRAADPTAARTIGARRRRRICDRRHGDRWRRDPRGADVSRLRSRAAGRSMALRPAAAAQQRPRLHRGAWHAAYPRAVDCGGSGRIRCVVDRLDVDGPKRRPTPGRRPGHSRRSSHGDVAHASATLVSGCGGASRLLRAGNGSPARHSRCRDRRAHRLLPAAAVEADVRRNRRSRGPPDREGQRRRGVGGLFRHSAAVDRRGPQLHAGRSTRQRACGDRQRNRGATAVAERAGTWCANVRSGPRRTGCRSRCSTDRRRRARRAANAGRRGSGRSLRAAAANAWSIRLLLSAHRRQPAQLSAGASSGVHADRSTDGDRPRSCASGRDRRTIRSSEIPCLAAGRVCGRGGDCSRSSASTASSPTRCASASARSPCAWRLAPHPAESRACFSARAAWCWPRERHSASPRQSERDVRSRANCSARDRQTRSC